MLKLKHRNLENPIFAPFLKKAIFRKLANIGDKKHKMITEHRKSSETPFL